MSTSIEELEIPKCPLCGEKHIYKLKIDRSPIMKFLTEHTLSNNMHWRTFTRIFVCPVKNEKFQATFKLYVDNEVESITIEGLLDHGEKEGQ